MTRTDEIKARLGEAQEWAKRCVMADFAEGMYPQKHLVKDLPWLLDRVEALERSIRRLADAWEMAPNDTGPKSDAINGCLAALSSGEGK